jgi:hypothetical protein
MRRGALKAREKQRINNLKILQFDSKDHLNIAKAKRAVDSFAEAIGISGQISESDILDALQRAHIASDEYYNLKHAAAWNTTFEFPSEAVTADMQLWEQCSHDFTLMCKTKQGRLADNRLSEARVREVFGHDGTMIPGMLASDFDLLLEFGRTGVTPILPNDFKPENKMIPPLRARYTTLKHTINSLLFEQWEKNTMILMTTAEAMRIDGAHFSPQHQADSKGKPEGRIIGDLSGQHDTAYTPLNGTTTSKTALRTEISDTWGEIKHPTITQLIDMVLTAADIHGWEALVLWKKDLKGAFNLINYNPAWCKLFAFPLSDGLTMIHLAGLFGWIGMPHAFQVLTRSLQALCSNLIKGWCLWYVDDLMAVSPISTYVKDSTIVDEKVQQLLGQGSIAAKKSQCARALEFLGWFLDLGTKTITLCERNLHKLLHALFCFDIEDKISIALIQRIASLVSRTSLLSRHMRPYTHELHIITSAYDIPNVRIRLTQLAQSDIIMWRSYSLLLVSKPFLLSRTLESFRKRDPRYCFKYDASLYRIAVGVHSAIDDELIVFAAIDLPFAVNNEARRQNTMEFTAIVFGLLLCWRLKITDFAYNLHGDSMSSLAWAQANRVNSTIARRSNIVFTTLSMHLNAHVAIATHIPGKLNVVYDGLSRNVSPAELGLDPAKEYIAADDTAIVTFLRLCDPDLPLDDIGAHTALLMQCQHLLVT